MTVDCSANFNRRACW